MKQEINRGQTLKFQTFLEQYMQSVVIVLVFLWLAACTSEKPRESVIVGKPIPEEAAMPVPAPLPPVVMPAATAPLPATAPKRADPSKMELSMVSPARHKVMVRNPASVKPPPPPATTSPVDSPETMIQRIDAYFSKLKTAAYTFNPPSPIRVAEPVTVYFWLDPSTTSAALAEELKKLVPRDAGRVESGQTAWSEKMRATLSGPSQDFEVKAVDPEEQTVSSTQRTRWSWDITPLHPGENLVLHLRLAVILPPELGSQKTITSIDKIINVEVTRWWQFDHYFEKYWRWLLGGLGTAMASIVAWWWKNRHAASKSAG